MLGYSENAAQIEVERRYLEAMKNWDREVALGHSFPFTNFDRAC
jgi:hypothetical protein